MALNKSRAGDATGEFLDYAVLLPAPVSNVSDSTSNGSSFLITRHDDADIYMTDKDLQEQVRQSFMTYHEPPRAVLIGLYCVAFFLGFVGNTLVIYIFARNGKMRTVTNSFLVNLAVCDLLVVLLCMPFRVASEVYKNWVYGEAMCKIVNFSQALSVASSIFTLAVISAERFYAIRRPLKARAFMSRTRIRRIIASIWCLAALVMTPIIFVRDLEELEVVTNFKLFTCQENWENITMKRLYNFALLILLYIAPVSFICVGYLQIGLNLWRGNATLHASESAAGSDNARANLAGRRKVAKMLFVMALLFVISFLPLHSMTIVLDFLQLKNSDGALLHVYGYTLWFALFNSSVNPICYCIMSQSFKTALRAELRRCFCRQVDNKRDAYRSMSMSLSVSTGNGQGHRNGCGLRVNYRPMSTLSTTLTSYVDTTGALRKAASSSERRSDSFA